MSAHSKHLAYASYATLRSALHRRYSHGHQDDRRTRRAHRDQPRAHGARVIGYSFNVNTRPAVARNAERTGRGKVPTVAIFTAAKRLQRPSLAEGFDQLFRVESPSIVSAR